MITIETLAEFFGWCSVINTGILAFTAIILMVGRKSLAAIHAEMFGMNESGLSSVYFQYLGNFKIAILILNLVPYVALKLMA